MSDISSLWSVVSKGGVVLPLVSVIVGISLMFGQLRAEVQDLKEYSTIQFSQINSTLTQIESQINAEHSYSNSRTNN